MLITFLCFLVILPTVYELWFRQIIFELDSIRDLFLAGVCDVKRHLVISSIDIGLEIKKK